MINVKYWMLLICMIGCIFVTGCLSTNLVTAGIVREELKPYRIIAAENFNIALETTCSYSRLSYARLVADDFRRAFSSEWAEKNYNSDDEIIIIPPKPIIRYVVIKPASIKHMLDLSTQTIARYWITTISIPEIDWVDQASGNATAKLAGAKAEVYPRRFYGTGNLNQLPTAFQNSTAAPLNKILRFRDGDRQLLIYFADVHISSGRYNIKWWVYALMPPAIIGDILCEVVITPLRIFGFEPYGT